MAAIYHDYQLLFTGNLVDSGEGIEQVMIQNGYLPSPLFPPPQNLSESRNSIGPIRPKKRRTRTQKNEEEMENKRMTHIAVERNRRRQMNDYLAVLRSIMPPSYSQRGDQASIVAGAINFVKEMEQLVQFLEAMKLARQVRSHNFNVFSKFFSFPQYTTNPDAVNYGERQRSKLADIEVSMVETHANIKVVCKREPKLLLRLVVGLHIAGLSILHLNITTVDPSVLYSFSVKVEENCMYSTVNEIATGVHDMLLAVS